MRVVLEDYGHYATGRKPREGEDALLVLDEFSALASGVDSAINLAERVRDVGVQVVVAAQSVEGLGDHRQAPRLLASCAGGIVVHQCPDPERLLALAGMVRTLEHNWELDFYGPRGLAKARMGDRPRIDPEAVRQAQPGEAWVIQAGQSIHLRVLPPPAVAPEPVELTATLPLAHDTVPLPRSRSRPRSGSPPPWPWPAGPSARSASGWAAGGSGRGGCPPRPAGRGWSGGPCPVGGGDEAAGGDRPRLRRRARGPRARTRTGRLPAGRAATWPPPASRALRYSLRSVPRVPAGRPAAALDPAVVQAARRDPVARGGRGAAPDQQAGGEDDRGGALTLDAHGRWQRCGRAAPQLPDGLTYRTACHPRTEERVRAAGLAERLPGPRR